MSLPILPTSPRREEITSSIEPKHLPLPIHADRFDRGLSLFEATGSKRGK